MELDDISKLQRVVKDSEILNEISPDFNTLFVSEQIRKALKLVLYGENTYKSADDAKYFGSKLIDGLYLLYSTKFKQIENIVYEYEPLIKSGLDEYKVLNHWSYNTSINNDSIVKYLQPSELYTLTDVNVCCRVVSGDQKDILSLDRLIFCVNAINVCIKHMEWCGGASRHVILNSITRLHNIRKLKLINIDFDTNILSKLTTNIEELHIRTDREIDMSLLLRLKKLKKLIINGQDCKNYHNVEQ
jgi:hypothetical protein